MIAHAITPTQMALHEARKARQARQAQMAARVTSNDNERVRIAARETDIPEWCIKATRFDAHVTDFRIAMVKDLAPKRAYLAARARDFGMTVEDITAKTRKAAVVTARQTVMMEMKEKWGEDISLPELGRMFGGLDHTTVLHAIRRAKAYRDGTAEMRRSPEPRKRVKSQGCFGPGKKIKPEMQDQIIAMFLAGQTRSQIAGEFGLAYKTIGALLKRRGVTA